MTHPPDTLHPGGRPSGALAPLRPPEGWHLTAVVLADQVPHDIKRLHDAVLHAALAGEPLRPVLWAYRHPSQASDHAAGQAGGQAAGQAGGSRVLIVRHDRPLPPGAFPAGWVRHLEHGPYWLPDTPGPVEWSVTVDTTRTAKSRAQWDRHVADRSISGLPCAPARPPSTYRTPAEAAGKVVAALTGAGLTAVTATSVAADHVPGRRNDQTRMWSNRAHVRGRGLITDPAAAAALMVEGVGRHRSFGCGLIIARPAGAAA